MEDIQNYQNKSQGELDSENGNNLPKFSLNIADKLSLYIAYMPYIKNGGLFIATTIDDQSKYFIGQLVEIDFTLSTSPTITFIGSVVWICPITATSRVSGLGIELPEDEGSKKLKQSIENALGQALNSSRATHIL